MSLDLIDRGPLKRLAIAGAVVGALASGVIGGKKLVDEFWNGPVEPSFNCALARHPSEVAICQNPKLARLDRHLAQLFAASINRDEEVSREEKLKEQGFFLRTRNQCRADVGCIKQRLGERIRAFEAPAPMPTVKADRDPVAEARPSAMLEGDR